MCKDCEKPNLANLNNPKSLVPASSPIPEVPIPAGICPTKQALVRCGTCRGVRMSVRIWWPSASRLAGSPLKATRASKLSRGEEPGKTTYPQRCAQSLLPCDVGFRKVILLWSHEQPD